MALAAYVASSGLARAPYTLGGVSLPAPKDQPHQAGPALGREPEAGGEPTPADVQMRVRAVAAAGLSFSIADIRQADAPLVYVNAAFERTTGYGFAEAVGHNCRFLQGPATDAGSVDGIGRAMAAGEHLVATLLNYRKDGSCFWNEVSLSPVYDGSGALTHYVGIQSDVTARISAEQERAGQLAAERDARADAERAQDRLALLAEATSMLAATLDVEESLARLAELVVPGLADFCTLDLLDRSGGLRRVSSRHRDAACEAALEVVERLQPTSLTNDSATAKVLSGGPAVLVERVQDDYYEGKVSNPDLMAAYRALHISSLIVVPLRARRQVLGALTLFADGSGRQFDQRDLATAADLARRAALTVDNARLYQHQHDVAEALQRSLLPRLPEVEGLEAAARYLPSDTAGEVGGDWYDLLHLPDGAVGLAIGDVMGHDITAAAAMGQFRSVLRSYAWQGGTPAQVLDHLDQLVQGLGIGQLATALYGRLDLPVDGLPGRLHYSNAGHLPPALRRPDGSVELLAEAQSLLVGAALGTQRAEATVEMPAGSVLVLYTDGLVEDRHRDIDDGLAALQAALAAAPADAEGICDALTTAMSTASRADDVALLVVRVL